MSHKPTIGRRWKIISLTAAITLTLAISTLAFAVQNIFIASDQVTDVQVGSTPVNQIFIGNQLVWERNTNPPEGSNPPNVISTNPAVLDIYPINGWQTARQFSP